MRTVDSIFAGTNAVCQVQCNEPCQDTGDKMTTECSCSVWYHVPIESLLVHDFVQDKFIVDRRIIFIDRKMMRSNQMCICCKYCSKILLLRIRGGALIAQIIRCFDVCCAGFANQLDMYDLLSDNCTMYDLRIEIELSSELAIRNCDEVAERATILDCLQHWSSLDIEH